jgi:hypothetical protein
MFQDSMPNSYCSSHRTPVRIELISYYIAAMPAVTAAGNSTISSTTMHCNGTCTYPETSGVTTNEAGGDLNGDKVAADDGWDPAKSTTPDAGAVAQQQEAGGASSAALLPERSPSKPTIRVSSSTNSHATPVAAEARTSASAVVIVVTDETGSPVPSASSRKLKSPLQQHQRRRHVKKAIGKERTDGNAEGEQMYDYLVQFFDDDAVADSAAATGSKKARGGSSIALSAGSNTTVAGIRKGKDKKRAKEEAANIEKVKHQLHQPYVSSELMFTSNSHRFKKKMMLCWPAICVHRICGIGTALNLICIFRAR